MPDRRRFEHLLGQVAALSPAGVSFAVQDAAGTTVAGEAAAASWPTAARRPIVVDGNTLGWVLAGTRSANGAGPQLAASATLAAGVIGALAGAEAEMDGLAHELLARYEEITLLYDLSEDLNSALDEPALCAVAAERCLRAIPASVAAVTLLGDEKGHFHSAGHSAGGPDTEADVWSPAIEEIAATVAATGREVLVHAGAPLAGHAAVPAFVSVPVVHTASGGEEDRPIGALTLVGRRPGENFSASDGRLAASVAFQLGVAIENSRLVRSQRAAERVQREIEIAAGIQRGLFPARPPELPGITLAGLCVPAARVGGDYYDFLLDGSGRLSLIIADVAGHSIGSALMMAMARAVLRREVSAGKSPSQVLGATNEALLDDLTTAGLFITAFCARFDRATRVLSFASGGHNHPLLYRADDAATLGLDADGMPMGVISDVDYEELSVEMAPGDLVLLYTDGVVEARDPMGEQFGDARLSQLVRTTGAEGPGLLTEGVYAAVQRHLGGESLQDDLTMLAFQFHAA